MGCTRKLARNLESERRKHYALGDKDEHNCIEHACGRVLEDEAGGDADRVETGQRLGDVDAEDGECNEEQNNGSEDEQYTVERVQRGANVADRAREEATLLVRLDECALDLRARDIPVVVLVENAKSHVCLLLSRERRPEVLLEQVVASTITEGLENDASQTLEID